MRTSVNRSLLPETYVNGGFPEPPPNEPVRVVAARHGACGQATRVRLPEYVPVRAVRRMCCETCAQFFDADRVEEVTAQEAAPRQAAASVLPAVAPAPPAQAAAPRFAAKGSAAAPGLATAKPLAAVAVAQPLAEAAPAPATPAATEPARSRPRLPKLPAIAKREFSLPKPKLPAAAKREVTLSKPKLPAIAKRQFSLPKPRLPEVAKREVSLSGMRPAAAAGRGISLPKLPDAAKREISIPKFDPQSRAWQIASIVIAGLLVIAVLMVVQGGDDASAPAPAVPEATGEAAGSGGGAPAGANQQAGKSASAKTTFVSGSTYSLVLPKGWEEVEPAGGATFAAVAPEGAADATLWIEEDPKLGFPEFVSNSLAQLQALAGSAEIVERQPAPTPEDTIVRLAADPPAGEPAYEVILRAAGPYRYHLAITTQPDAPADVIEGTELIAGSLTPEAKG